MSILCSLTDIIWKLCGFQRRYKILVPTLPAYVVKIYIWYAALYIGVFT